MADIKKAIEAKEKGNAAYKKKDFDAAHQHYDEAIALDPTNMTFLTNKAAVYFEQGNLDVCLQTCEKAVEVGRSNRADFKLVAKAFARMASTYLKKEELENALSFFNKSLSEHRSQDIVKKVLEVKHAIAEKERLEYRNPELANKEKEKGNALFREGKYPDAIAAYSEAIKRNPDDFKLYSNRAACYTKLMEFNLALKDSEECIRLDPNFIKGHLRKGACLFAMKENSKARFAYEKAIEIDPTNHEALDGYRKTGMLEEPEDTKKAALSHPEVQEILKDPAMQMILTQMQQDPRAASEHLKDPGVKAKIQKLMEHGIVNVR